jgi:hypothetical protein
MGPTLEAAGVVKVELLQAPCGSVSGGKDAALAAVALSGCDLASQADDQALLMRPGLGAARSPSPGTDSRSAGPPAL